MDNASGLFGLSDHMKRISEDGDPLETLETVIDFEWFRTILEEALNYGDGAKGGRPPFDPVTMFKAMILQAQHNLSDRKMEMMIRDRLSWMRFLGFQLGGRTPDENTIRLFRNKITESGALPLLCHRMLPHRWLEFCLSEVSCWASPTGNFCICAGGIFPMALCGRSWL